MKFSHKVISFMVILFPLISLGGTPRRQQVCDYINSFEKDCFREFRGYVCESRGFYGISTNKVVVRVGRIGDVANPAFTIDTATFKSISELICIPVGKNGEPLIDGEKIIEYERIAEKFVPLRLIALSYSDNEVLRVILPIDGRTSLLRLPSEIDPVVYFKNLSADYSIEKIETWYWVKKKVDLE